MSICSIWFLVFVCLTVLLFQLCGRKSERRLFLGTVNLAFLSTLVPNQQSWVCLIFFVGATFAILCFIRGWPSYNNVLALLGFVVVVFLFLKGYLNPNVFLPSDVQVGPIAIIGISYMLFKFIHMLVDQWQGQLAPFGFFSYVNYQLAFFTLQAGPIQRYNDFQRGWQEMDADAGDRTETLQSWSRALSGFLKMGVLAPAVEYLCMGQKLTAEPSADLLQRFAGQFYGYPIYLYFNFSGYTDIMIGCGRLLGFRLPENFNRPYLARNVIDFWNRWHMTLTHWIRDYVFMTSYKRVAETVPSLARPIGYGLLFLSLFIAGVWHGATLGFAVFGVIHGIGVAVNQAYGDALKTILGRAGFQRYQKNTLIHALAWFVTFHFVCFSFLFFAMDVGQVLNVLQAAVCRLGDTVSTMGVPSFQTFAPVEIALMLLLALKRPLAWIKDKSTDVLGRIAGQPIGLYSMVLLKTVLIVLAFLSLWVFEQRDPVLVYMRF